MKIFDHIVRYADRLCQNDIWDHSESHYLRPAVVLDPNQWAELLEDDRIRWMWTKVEPITNGLTIYGVRVYVDTRRKYA